MRLGLTANSRRKAVTLLIMQFTQGRETFFDLLALFVVHFLIL